jgi:hypothetical protein
MRDEQDGLAHRSPGQRTSQVNPLSHPAGELVRITVFESLQSDNRDELSHSFVDDAAADAG